jgi:hypothetical protein
MNLLWMLTLIAKSDTLPADAPTVPVLLRIECKIDAVHQLKARMLTSQIIASAGIRVEWASRRDVDRTGLIVVTLKEGAPTDLKPGALAEAFPFEGKKINIYMDRVLRSAGGQKAFVAAVLAHSIAHEVGHILFATTNHSDSPIMKAGWTSRDLVEMQGRPFRFRGQEAEELRAGARRRASGEVLASLR